MRIWGEKISKITRDTALEMTKMLMLRAVAKAVRSTATAFLKELLCIVSLQNSIIIQAAKTKYQIKNAHCNAMLLNKTLRIFLLDKVNKISCPRREERKTIRA